MSFFDQFSKVTKDFGNKAQEMTKDIKGKLEEQQALARLKSQKAEAENQIRNTYTAIGEMYYQQHRDDEENGMESQFQVIKQAEERIVQYEQQIKAIKNESTCPNCGAAISKEVLFCPNCGTKIERPQPEPQPEEPAQKVCPVCGSSVDEEDMFCTNCGASIGGDAEPEFESEQAQEPQTTEEEFVDSQPCKDNTEE